jgi:hypothetical protein
LLQIYQSDDAATPPELLELLDIAEARLASAGYRMDGSPLAESDSDVRSL